MNQFHLHHFYFDYVIGNRLPNQVQLAHAIEVHLEINSAHLKFEYNRLKIERKKPLELYDVNTEVFEQCGSWAYIFEYSIENRRLDRNDEKF